MERQKNPPPKPHPLPRKLPSPSLEPIAIPRAEHLPLPLSSSLRADLSAHLMASGTISTLRRRLDVTCAEVGWADKVHARALQLLRESGGAIGVKRLEETLVREALGQEDQDHLDDVELHESVEDGDGQVKRKAEVKAADIALPQKVRDEGRKIVREGMEGVNVEVKKELTDGWVV